MRLRSEKMRKNRPIKLMALGLIEEEAKEKIAEGFFV